jgi:iron complex transport system ATP-binding protein
MFNLVGAHLPRLAVCYENPWRFAGIFTPVIPVFNLNNVSVIRDGKNILGPLDWVVNENERWVILGPNGAGKSTLFALCSSQIHPTAGTVEILGSRLGAVDVFELRPRIGFMGSTLLTQFPEDEKVIDIVLTAAYAMLGRWNESYELWDESRAQGLLTTLGVRQLADRQFFTLSEGEKKRTLIARALMADPEILLLDEPASGLDLGGREDLLNRFDLLANDPTAPVTLMITHHIEEIPSGSTNALLLKAGAVVASGEISSVITSENLSNAYDMPINVTMQNSRYSANALN